MNRRTAIKAAAGGLVGGGAALLTLNTAFKPEILPATKPKELNLEEPKSDWVYHRLEPAVTANLAYSVYDNGSCMYAVVQSFISQLAEKYGEPYSSFPIHMTRYGHGGIGGFGNVCGALNGTAALAGLFVTDKNTRDAVITDLFRWYERTPLPDFNPDTPIDNFTPPLSIARSTLCHASITNWSKTAGYNVKSKQRKERCRRLTGNMAGKLATVMNQLNEGSYTTVNHDDETARGCLTCHGSQGKFDNTGGKMTCTSCHSKSIGHRLFGDIHYKFMGKKDKDE